MTLTQSLIPIIIFWAILGGVGAALLLPGMQSLIHGNFEGEAQRRGVRAGRSRGCNRGERRSAARGVHNHLSIVASRVPDGGRHHRDRAVRNRTRARRAVHRTTRGDVFGAGLSILGMGGIVLGILVWQEGGESVGALLLIGAIALVGLVIWVGRRKRQGRPSLLTQICSSQRSSD
jgi:LPXTG-motif cell wall-anchored protein